MKQCSRYRYAYFASLKLGGFSSNVSSFYIALFLLTIFVHLKLPLRNILLMSVSFSSTYLFKHFEFRIHNIHGKVLDILGIIGIPSYLKKTDGLHLRL